MAKRPYSKIGFPLRAGAGLRHLRGKFTKETNGVSSFVNQDNSQSSTVVIIGWRRVFFLGVACRFFPRCGSSIFGGGTLIFVTVGTFAATIM